MTESKYVEDLVDQEHDFDRWYVEVVQRRSRRRRARPRLQGDPAVWLRVVGADGAARRRIKATGVENAYFPLFIPRSMLEREADHIEGFAPEVAWVNGGGDHELEEPWAVRPTSEAIICPSYARWVSYRDLPILINQWGNAVRWEERPRAQDEFLWQEGHLPRNWRGSGRTCPLMLEVYQRFFEEDLAIPVVPGLKTESEKFAGRCARTRSRP